MELVHIGVFSGLGLLYSLLIPGQWRTGFVFVVSILAVYWLQPTLNIRWLDFSLPTIMLGLIIGCWLLIYTTHGSRISRDDWRSFVVICGIVLFLNFGRYFEFPIALTARPPEIWHSGLFLGLLALLIALQPRRHLISIPISVVIMLLIALFIVLKTEPLSTITSRLLRGQSGQDTTLASALDIQWLGFSYIAFRLIHTLRDHQNGLLPVLTLQEYVSYMIFFPAYAAGPIDRAERFVNDYRLLPTLIGRDANRIMPALLRIGTGLFKKFVIADSLAFFSLSAVMLNQTQSSLGVWVMLYSYAFRLYFDFSGYTDIAIGIGMLYGIQLPENFDYPYGKNTITAFWQSWHITLSNWVRTYVYSPLSRTLLKSPYKPSTIVIILICTLATMLVIGLWHGVTLSFTLWGMWHGIGLFVHKVWSDRTRAWYRGIKQRPFIRNLWTATGVLLTFHFVLLGWVWFALPDPAAAILVFEKLLGLKP